MLYPGTGRCLFFYYLIHTDKKKQTIKCLGLDVDRYDLPVTDKSEKTNKNKTLRTQLSFFGDFVFHSHSSFVCLLNVPKLWGMKLQAPCAWNNLKWLYQRFASLYSTCEYSASYAETGDLGWSRISSSSLRVSLSVVSSSVTKYAKDVAATEI